MVRTFKAIWKDEDGAVTVDWVVVTAAAAGGRSAVGGGPAGYPEARRAYTARWPEAFRTSTSSASTVWTSSHSGTYDWVS